MTYTDPYVEDWHDGKICGESWVMEHSPGNTEGVSSR